MVKPDKIFCSSSEKRESVMRYIGIDLHTNSLTACYYDGNEVMILKLLQQIK